MTLVLTWLGKDHVIQASDRRLVSSTGQVAEDAANKASCVELRDSRLAIAFAGVACVGPTPSGYPILGTPCYKTDNWIHDVAWNVASVNETAKRFVEELRLQTENLFLKYLTGVPASLLDLSIVACGFVGKRPHAWLISNCEGNSRSQQIRHRFTTTYLSRDRVYVHGDKRGWTSKSKAQHRTRIRNPQGRSHAVILAELVRLASQLPGCTSIGGNLLTTRVFPQGLPFESTFYPINPATLFDYTPNLATPSGNWYGTVTAVAAGSAMAPSPSVFQHRINRLLPVIL